MLWLKVHWKTMHRAIYSEKKPLPKMNKSNGKQKLCIHLDKTASPTFLMYKGKVWTKLQGLFNDFKIYVVPLNIQTVIFGITADHLKSENEKLV